MTGAAVAPTAAPAPLRPGAATGGLVVADGDALLRSALAAVLAAEGHAVRGTAGHADTLPDLLAGPDRPALLLLSATLPGAATADLLRRLGPDRPRVLVVGPDSDHERLLDALDAGAQGYVGQDAGLAELLAAVAAVLRAEAVVPPHMLGGLLHELVQQGRPGDDVLSRREREVLALLAEGHAQEGIARRLAITQQTARTHIQRVISKLGAHSRVEAVARGLAAGLVPSTPVPPVRSSA